MLALGTILLIVLIVTLAGVGILIAGVAYEEAHKKKRLAALPSEISASIANALAATGACVEMQVAASMAEAAFSAADINVEEYEFEDGLSEKELLEKAGEAGRNALNEFRCLIAEGIDLTKSSEYVKLRTYVRLACAACEECDFHLCQGSCPASEFLKKIKLK